MSHHPALYGRRRTRAVSRSGSSSIDPSSISGLVYWFKADGSLWQDVARNTPATADGDPVGSWGDASIGAAHATQAAAGRKPLLKTGANGINGLPVVRFDGTDDMLESPASSGTKPFTLLAVVKPTSFVAAHPIVGSPGQGIALDTDTTTGNLVLVKTAIAVIATSSTAPTAATPSVVEATYSSAGVYTFYVNGTSAGTGTNNLSLLATTTIIGKDNTSYMLGDIAEIIKYDTVLSASDLQGVENYLGAKWGITVA